MFSVSQLSDDQKIQIEAWAADGAQLPGIQKKIQEEFKIKITYMDTRFLVLDLGIELVKEEVVEEPAVAEEVKVAAGVVDATVDEIERPGALKSGSATFSDGEKAMWMIDQEGRLSIDPETPGYEVGEEDLIKFQEKLRDMLA